MPCEDPCFKQGCPEHDPYVIPDNHGHGEHRFLRPNDCAACAGIVAKYPDSRIKDEDLRFLLDMIDRDREGNSWYKAEMLLVRIQERRDKEQRFDRLCWIVRNLGVSEMSDSEFEEYRTLFKELGRD